MPYTQEELNNLPFYQKLIDADENAYLKRRDDMIEETQVSGSLWANETLLNRDQNDGTILLFENPFQNRLPEDDTTRIVHQLSSKKLKTEQSYGILDDIIDRKFEEL